MAELMDDKTKKELRKLLGSLSSDVEIVFFTQENACPMCREQKQILSELAALSDRLKLVEYDFVKDAGQAAKFKIDKIPATAIVGKKDNGIRFYGMTGGYEFSSLVEAVLMVGTGRSGLSPELEKLVKAINEEVIIEVMVTLTCPYCPQAVHGAQQLALVSDRISVFMVDAAEFPQLAQRYNVSGVPKTVINQRHSFVGVLPVQSLYLEILKAVNPKEYRRVEAAIRTSEGHRHVRKSDPRHNYDAIIVGGGPAAMSAAIYAVRKGMDVLLIASEVGGQVTNTAVIENYLGMPGVSGRDMIEQFLFHMEQFPIAEHTGSALKKVSKEGERFIVAAEDGAQFTGHSLIYCAGKEYRRLGIPGEERFIGRGIAFCATCDAPLYQNKKVAVIGGGNSAFTSVRDLIGFAAEIYLIHRRDAFTADPVLVEEIKKARNVKFYTNSQTQEFLGKDRLEGIRLITAADGKPVDLQVDGVFLEIGLVPNSAPVKDLVKLNGRGEIPVSSDNSTNVPGLYAAGDVTDIPEKQIIIAAGEGAKAALSAHKYLLEKKLIKAIVLPEYGA